MFELSELSTLTSNILPLVGALLAFYSIITVHEFGHFIFCKIFNVKTPTFSIGAGPVLLKKKLWDTKFVFSLFPVGGFVEIGGLSEPGQGSQELAQDLSDQSFETKPYWQKMLILCGGIMFNLIFAFGIYTSLFYTGMPKSKVVEITIKSIIPNGPADKAGIIAGDIFVGINHKLFAEKGSSLSISDFSAQINGSANKPLHFLVKRNGETIQKEITPEPENPEDASSSAKLQAELSSNLTYEISEGTSIINAIKKSFTMVESQVTESLSTFKRLFKERSIKGIGGPVMIVSQLFKTAQANFKLLLLFVSFINVGIATMNMLPLGALDGGQIMFTTIEAIFRRRLSDTFKITVNVISLGFFFLLFVYLTFRDVLNLFGK